MPVLSKQARLYTLMFGRLAPPSLFGRKSLVKAILGLPFLHKKFVIALFRICISLCFNSKGKVCRGYKRRAKLTILNSAHLPKSESSRSDQAKRYQGRIVSIIKRGRFLAYFYAQCVSYLCGRVKKITKIVEALYWGGEFNSWRCLFSSPSICERIQILFGWWGYQFGGR